MCPRLLLKLDFTEDEVEVLVVTIDLVVCLVQTEDEVDPQYEFIEEVAVDLDEAPCCLRPEAEDKAEEELLVFMVGRLSTLSGSIC